MLLKEYAVFTSRHFDWVVCADLLPIDNVVKKSITSSSSPSETTGNITLAYFE